MEINEQPNEKSWNLLQQNLDASFLQSEIWEEFQHALGLKIHKLNGNGWTCLLIERHTKLGSYLFAPYGPTLANSQALSKALSEIRSYGEKAGAAWVRLEPCLGHTVDSDFGEALFKQKFKVVKAPKQIEPLFTRVLNLEPDAAELLAGISKTTRYIIRKNDTEHLISFKSSGNPDDVPIFTKMLGTVSDRNNVFFHSESYFLKQAQTLMPAGHMWLEFALKDNQPIACIVMSKFHKTATYLYAASLPEARSTNASALLLWQAMLNAKAAGLTLMDLYGVAPEGAGPSHPWQGFTAFKQKFGGTIVRRGETIDLPLKPIYSLYRLAYKIRRLA